MDVARRADYISLMNDALPIEDQIPSITAALRDCSRLVLAAPPGAGKTTRLPLALFDEPWNAGKSILLLEPRRIAARMAAERMASLLDERVGRTIGLTTRVDRLVSSATRIEIVTDGLLSRRIVADPELKGVGAVLFDEFHERSLALDLGLALALETQSALRPDLRLLIMSATLDTARIASAVGAPSIESAGRQHKVDTIYLGRSDSPLQEQVARAVRRALRDQDGSVLVFLPGRAEIGRAAEKLLDLSADVITAPLYGALSPGEQDAAVRPAQPGKRKVVLATDIAESSLTIAGVGAVVDAGLARVAEFEPESGERLVTRRASRASIDQRRGRAGRLGPGLCFRLWDEAETRGLPAERTPEILAGDLASLVLTLAEWGEADPMKLTWIDPPPAGRVAAAKAQLVELGALDVTGRLTSRGRDMARLPVDPKLAAMIAGARNAEDRGLAAEIAALLSERGLGGDAVDLTPRIENFRRDKSARAASFRQQASKWSGGGAAAPAHHAGRVIAAAMPLRIARARPGDPGGFTLAGGRAARLDAADALSSAPWLAVADITGIRAAARILAAARLSEEDALFLGNPETVDSAQFDPETKSIKARRTRRLGAIVLSETPLPTPSGPIAQQALIDALREHGFGLLPGASAILETQARLSLARRLFGEIWPRWSDADLLDKAEAWIVPLLGAPPSLERPTTDEIRRALSALLDWSVAGQLDEIAPLTVEAASGRALPVDYLAEGGPMIEARVQEFYGLTTHPAIARGRAPLTVSLLSPAHRQIALTKDLPTFWTGGYRDMAKDMRGRYPKHDWPADPAAARPHEGRTKARL